MRIEEALLHPDFELVNQWFMHVHEMAGDVLVFFRKPHFFCYVMPIPVTPMMYVVHLVVEDFPSKVVVETQHPFQAVHILLSHPVNVHMDKLTALGLTWGKEA